MQSHLHQAIMDHASQEIIAPLVKAAKDQINALNPEGLTALQLAAREGNLETVIQLVNAGADIDAIQYDEKKPETKKSALYLAAEYNHPLVIQFLLLCDANKLKVTFLAAELKESQIEDRLDNIKLNPNLCLGLLARSLTPRDNESLDFMVRMLLPKPELEKFPKHLSALIELAMKYNHTTKLADLLGKAEVRYQRGVFTAAYWDTIQNPTKQDSLRKTANDQVALLRQLEHTGKEKEFELSYKQASEEAKKEFRNHPNIDHKFVEEKLSSVQKHIYNAVARGNAAEAKLFCDTDADYYAVVIYAYTLKNYVALDALVGVRDPLSLIKAMLQHNQFERAIFWLINAKMDLYDTALQLANDKEVLDKFIELCWSPEGLLYSIYSHGMHKDKLPSDASLILLHNLPKSDDVSGILQRCIQHSVAVANLNQSDAAVLVTDLRRRFSRADENVPDDHILIKKIGRFSDKEHKWIREVSPHYNELVMLAKNDPEARRYHLQQQIAKLTAFMDQLDADINSRGWCSQRMRGFLQLPGHKLSSLALGAGLIGAAIGAYYLGTYLPIYNNSSHLLDVTKDHWDSRTCAQVYYGYNGDKCPTDDSYRYPTEEPCKSLCDKYNDAHIKTFFGGILGLGLGVLVSLPGDFALGSYLKTRWHLGSERFDDMSISEFSSETINSAAALLAVFKDVEPNPFADCNLDILITTFFDVCTSVHAAKQAELDKLPKPISPPLPVVSVIEIKDEKKVDVIPAKKKEISELSFEPRAEGFFANRHSARKVQSVSAKERKESKSSNYSPRLLAAQLSLDQGDSFNGSELKRPLLNAKGT